MPWYRIIHFSIMALGILAGAVRFKRLSASSRWGWRLLVITFINEWIAWYLAQTVRANYALSYFFIPIQFGCISAAFVQDLKLLRKPITICVLAVILLSIAYTIRNVDVLQDIYPSTLRTIANVLIIMLCLLWFRQMLYSVQEYSFTQYPMFWLSLGWLSFVIITLFGFSAFNYLTENKAQAETLSQNLRIGANFMLYSLFIIAFLSRQRQIGATVVYGKQ